MEFKIQVIKARVHPITFCINYYHLNIKILAVTDIPGPGPSDRMDTEVTLKLLSDDLGEVYLLGFYTAQEKLAFTLGT